MQCGLTLNPILEQAEQTVPLLSELAKVVAQEKLLLEECLDLSQTISTLEVIKERYSFQNQELYMFKIRPTNA